MPITCRETTSSATQDPPSVSAKQLDRIQLTSCARSEAVQLLVGDLDWLHMGSSSALVATVLGSHGPVEPPGADRKRLVKASSTSGGRFGQGGRGI